MALPLPPSYTNPIPNNPFFSPESYIIQGAYYPFVVGAGISVSPTGVISTTGGGGGVSSLTAGPGIFVTASTGAVTVSNVGVTSVVAGTGITVSGATGAVTINSTNTGTVTSITAGAGLTGGVISTSGVIALGDTTVTPGTYTASTITVDAQGRITSASSGTAVSTVTGTAPINVTAGANPVVSVAGASTASSGVVQLDDSVTSISSSTAATSLAVKTAYDAAILAIPKSCLTAKGDLITASAASIPLALPVGANGEILTADSACSGGLKWAAAAATGITSITAGVGLSGGTITSTGTIALNPATSAAIGGLKGCVAVNGFTGSITALGCLAGAGYAGNSAGMTAIGSFALNNLSSGDDNTAVGSFSGQTLVNGVGNTLLGRSSGPGLSSGSCNVFLGLNAGSSVAVGIRNVVIGPQANTPEGSCQLAIGYDSTNNWLTGDSSKAIKPGAGIIDCANSCGTNGQVLMSDGANAVCWGGGVNGTFTFGTCTVVITNGLITSVS